MNQVNKRGFKGQFLSKWRSNPHTTARAGYRFWGPLCTIKEKGLQKPSPLIMQIKWNRNMSAKHLLTCVKHCHLPKTVNFGHSRHIGERGLDTFCPTVEGKHYPDKEAWLKARKKEPPNKKSEKWISLALCLLSYNSANSFLLVLFLLPEVFFQVSFT